MIRIEVITILPRMNSLKPQTQQFYFSRFVAAFIVFFYHFAQAPHYNVYPFSQSVVLNKILTSGNIWVGYFFMLSGFIMSIAYSHKIKTLPTFIYYWLFRFIRIYPLYLCALIIMLISFFKDTKNPYIHFFLIQSWFPEYIIDANLPAWSLSVEVFFYASFPFLVLFLKWVINRFSIRTSLFLFLSIFILLEGLNYAFPSIPVPIRQYDLFYVGAVLGIVIQVVKITISPLKNTFLFLVSIITITWLMYINEYQDINYSIFIIPFVGLHLCQLCLPQRIITFLSHKTFILLGEISYGIYILQWPVFHSINKALQGTKLQEKVFSHIPETLINYSIFLLLVALAYYGYVYLESPLRRIAKSYISTYRISKQLLFIKQRIWK